MRSHVELLSLAEVQRALGVSRATVGRLIADGSLAIVQLRPHRTAVEADELKRFVEDRRARRSKSDAGRERTRPVAEDPAGSGGEDVAEA